MPSNCSFSIRYALSIYLKKAEKYLLESAIGNRDISYFMGNNFAHRFFLAPPETREMLWAYAMKNGAFAEGLGAVFGHYLECSRDVFPGSLQEIESVSESNKDFLKGIQFHLPQFPGTHKVTK